MKFKFFSPNEKHLTISTRRSVFNNVNTDVERAGLVAALHALLESLPQSYNGQENIKLLCDTILNATPHLRFVWVGFCEGADNEVEPYVAVGECASECQHWRLPNACFDFG